MPLPPDTYFYKTKKPLPQHSCWDKSIYTPAVPPDLACLYASPLVSRTAMRASLVTGEAPVAPNLCEEARIALVSPFAVGSSAAIAPPAALLKRLCHGYYSYSSVCRFGFVAIICRDFASVNRIFTKKESYRKRLFYTNKPYQRTKVTKFARKGLTNDYNC